MRLAEKFRRPIIVFVDTPAAYPGIESEERGVAEAIAANLRDMMLLDTPIIVCVSGEGGSGGALGIAVGDRVLMQEFAIYSVIPPEGCAAILWRDAGKKMEAAAALKLTAPDLLKAAIIDEDHPGADRRRPHRSRCRRPRWSTPCCPARSSEVSALDSETRLALRYEKFRRMGRAGIEFTKGKNVPDEDAEGAEDAEARAQRHRGRKGC